MHNLSLTWYRILDCVGLNVACIGITIRKNLHCNPKYSFCFSVKVLNEL